MTEAPRITAGPQCSTPFTCEFFDHCNPPLPDENVLKLPRIHATEVAKLAALDIQSIRDIPETYPLSARLRRACTCVQTGVPWYDSELKNALDTLKYPLYYMDFETVSPCLPRFPGMRPYDQLPFQWSVHVEKQVGAEPEHFEFLAPDSSDLRRTFISTLCDALGEHGSIMVYNATFESQRLSELAVWFPEFSGRVRKIQRRLWDLLPIIRNHVYHPQFCWSFSLKSVLSPLVPGMSYDGMAVADGQAAGLAWESLISGDCEEGEREQERKALLDYCGQDTLAMVKIIDVLRWQALN